ncbi:hypothetical protein M9458_051305, partial [Cirrhinus mrigala]
LQASMNPLPTWEEPSEPQPAESKADIPPMVETMIDPSLWSQYKDKIGFIDMEPYKAKLKTKQPVYIKQYPLSKDKELGIKPLIDNFVQQGVLVPTHSPYNTPINPVVKADGKTWRLTQDLRAINKLIMPLVPIVPDVPIVFNSIACMHKYFAVIDLCAAFFSVPVHPETQPILAFTFQSAQYTWTCLAQGYVDSPAVFSVAVQRTLAKMTDLPSTVCVLQYADDLIISSETREDCEKASIIVCNVPAQAGFKASKEKLQWVQPKVTYLGHIIMPGLRAISTDRVQMIRKMKSPQTVQQLQSFLGLVNYCRSWIPDCAIHDKYLRSLIDRKAPPKTQLNWTDEAEMHFAALKKAITTAPSLGLPSFEKEFHLHVRETEGVAMGVLLQQHGSTNRPVAYLSKKLDNVAAGMPACLRAVSAAAIVVQMAERIVLSHPMIVYTSHQVGAILHNMQTQHMTAQRRSGYEAILLATKNLTIQPTSSINPALLGVLGMADMIDDNESHDCIIELTSSCSSRADLLDSPLDGGEHIYVDGSCSKPFDGVYLCGYAVVSETGETIEAYALDYNSAQAAKLIALIRACKLMEENGDFKTADGKPITHSNLIGQLTEAVQLPAEVAIVKVKGHAAGDDEQAVGNRKADEAAKQAAKAQIKPPFDMGNLKYLLVIVDQFSKWPEAFPCAKEDVKTVVKILTKEIIPRFGIPTTIESDNGTPFACRVTQFLAKSLSIDWHFSIPYHPHSCSNVECLKKAIKRRLNKAVLETGKKWVDLLSAVLTEIRMTPSSTTKLSPFEILMGRPFPTPWVKGRTGIASLGDLEVIQKDYVTSLIEKLNSICADVSLCFPLPSEKPTHPFVPGQSVLIKSLKLTRIGEPKYLGPATVITVTRTGVLTNYQPQ